MSMADQTLGWSGNRGPRGAAVQGPSIPQQASAAPYPLESTVNVGGQERFVSLASGALLALLGLGRRNKLGMLIAGVGAGLIYRGATGHCSVYNALGVDTANDPERTREHLEEAAAHGLHVAQSLLINKTPEELYKFWRNFENLPKIMTQLESVHVIDERRSHWVTKAPRITGGKVEWDAEIIEDVPNARIAWRSLPGADVDNQGSVTFTRALGDRGTAVRIVMDYNPPAGRLGKWVASLFGKSPEQQVWKDLHDFKRFMEIGEIPTTAGQPRGTCAG